MVSSALTPLIIAGPTGSGKSSLAIKLALKHKGEIICADSRQCYKFMSIGSACPTKEDKSKIVHHGYEMLDPRTQKMSAGFFVTWALEKIAEIQKKGKRPIIVGGTGLYLRALRYGVINVPLKDEELNKRLEAECTQIGTQKMHEKLFQIDEESAKAIMSTDKLRILRALEIYYLTGEKPSSLRQNFTNARPQIAAHWLLLKPNREVLKKNLEARVKKMFAEGLIKESLALQTLLPKGHWALETMGFNEAILYCQNELSLEQAIEKTLIRHRQYAKRQYTWFKREMFYKFIFAG